MKLKNMTTLNNLRVVAYAFVIFQSLSCEIEHCFGDDPLSEKMTNLKICGESEVQILILKQNAHTNPKTQH